MQDHYDFSGGERGKYAGKVDTADQTVYGRPSRIDKATWDGMSSGMKRLLGVKQDQLLGANVTTESFLALTEDTSKPAESIDMGELLGVLRHGKPGEYILRGV